MSLSGLRDISVIETPPEGRRPIRTYVGEYDDELVQAALEREHAREGQAFYLHNRVETIDEAAERLRQLVPGPARASSRTARCGSASSRSRCTPSSRATRTCSSRRRSSSPASTSRRRTRSIVERADALGLAQLYQIRGRVGRSDVPAHAYLFYPDSRELTPEARARLATLADHTELGAGFAIAMRDLEIRGAGDLLGAEQSGHVAALGFELYVELLGEAVAELSGRAAAGGAPGARRRDASTPTCRRRYIEAEALKIDLHRRLALTRVRGRAARAARRDRGSLRPAARSRSRTCSRSRRRS